VEKSSLRDGRGSHSRFLGLAWRVTCRPCGVVSGSRGAGVPGLRACVGSGLGLGLGFRVRGVWVRVRTRCTEGSVVRGGG